MKKYLGFLMVLTLFILGGAQAHAAVSVPGPCDVNASPSITILSPNGGEVYQPGQQITVKWTSCNISANTTLNIGLYVDIGNNFGAITSSTVLNSGQGIINIPTFNYTNNNAVSNNYIIMLSSNELNINGKSNIFTIKSPTSDEAPFIKVISPNGGEVVNISNPVVVTFKSNNPYPAKHYINAIDVDLGKAYSLDSLLGSYGISYTQDQINQPTQSISVTIPASYKVNLSHKYKIEICVNNICDKSDGTFKITKTSVDSACPIAGPLTLPYPYLKVISPNGGEAYQAGQKIEVIWSSCFVQPTMSNIVISLHQNGEWDNVVYLTNATLNDGKEIFTIPSSIQSGKYKIRVGSSWATIGQDFSDNLFTITSSIPVPTGVYPIGCNSSDGFSAISGLPCFIETNEVTSITKNTAVLDGRLIAGAPNNMFFTYKKVGNGNEIFNTSKIVKQNNGSFSYSLSGLSPNTSYEFSACMYYLGAKTCARQLIFTTSPVEIIGNGCVNGEIYSSTTGQKCTGQTYPIYKENPIVSTSTAVANGVLKRGLKNASVLAIQNALIKLGYQVTADGSFGIKTENAVKLFQVKNGFKPDGIIGAITKSALVK